MDLGVLVAASRPAGGPRQPSLTDLDHITGTGGGHGINFNHRNVAGETSYTQGLQNSPRLEELARPRNDSKMSLSHTRYHNIKKNSDRLPDFTLNYLELMESCMDNLTNKSNALGGNPFSMGQMTIHQARATRGVFKETKLPKFKNVQYLSKRQQLQRRQMKQHQSEDRDVSHMDQLGNQQITVNRLAAVQRSPQRVNAKQKQPTPSLWRPEEASESGVATVELSHGIDQTGPSTLTQNPSNDLDRPSYEYQLKAKLAKTGGAFSVTKHNKQRSEIAIESDIASTFKTSKPISPSPFLKSPQQIPPFPIGTPQITVNHLDALTPVPQHFRILDPSQLIKSENGPASSHHHYRANTSHLVSSTLGGGVVSPQSTYQPFKQYLNNKLLRNNKYKSGNNTPPHLVEEGDLRPFGVNGQQMRQIPLPNMINRMSMNSKDAQQKTQHQPREGAITIDIDQYSKQIDQHFQQSSYRNDAQNNSLYSIEENHSPKNLNHNTNSTLGAPALNQNGVPSRRRDSNPTLSNDYQVGGGGNQRSSPDVAYVPIPLNQIKIVTTNNGGAGANNTSTSLNGQSASGKYLQQNPSVGGKSLKQSQQLGNISISGIETLAQAPPFQQIGMGHRKTIAVSHLQGSQSNPHHATHSSQATGAEDDDLMVMMLMQSQLNGQPNIFDYKDESRIDQLNKGMKPQMTVVTRPRQVRASPLVHGLQQLSKEDIEHLVPWRYSSKDYFLRPPPAMSPSSLAPKSNALSTETTFRNMDKKTQQQRLFLKDNPQFLAQVEEIMVSSARKNKKPRDNSNPLTSVQEVMMQAQRQQQQQSQQASPRGGNPYMPTNPSQFPQISSKFPPAGHINSKLYANNSKASSNSVRSQLAKTNSPRRRKTGQSMYNQVVNVRVNLDYFPNPTQPLNAPHGPPIMLQNYNSDERESRTSSATSHLKPSRLKDYHTDAIAQNDALKNAGGQSPSKVTTPPLIPIYSEGGIGKSTIETDRRNLNQAVFGISLKSHWVFKGSIPQHQQQRNLDAQQHHQQQQSAQMNNTQTSLLGGGSVLTPQPMKAKVLLQQHLPK